MIAVDVSPDVVESINAGRSHVADEPGLIEAGQVTRVMSSERSDPDHADRQPRDHAGTPRSDDSTKARNRSTSGEFGRSLRARSSACERLSSELKNSR